MDTGPEAYAAIASFYEAEYGALEADVAYFARNGSYGPLLVLGCGTGRVGRVLGSSRRVIGLDRSAAMLDIARSLAPEAEYVLGDMTDFALGMVGEIVAPNGALNFLPNRAAQASCLHSCARALAPGATLTLDMPMPDFRRLGEAHTPEKLAWSGEIDGRAAKRTREVHRFVAKQRLELHERYYIEDEMVAESTLPLRWVFPAEVEWMFESCGFAVEALHGNYAGSPLSDTSPRLIARGIRL